MIALRVLSLSVVLALATTARAGAVVELVFAKSASEFNPQGAYLPGEIVNMEIRLADSSVGGDRLLRLVQLNFDAMDVNLTIQSFQWQFGGAGHYKDEALDSGPEGVAIAYYFVDSDELGPNPTAQTVLPGNGSAVLVATLDLVMPVLEGSYDFDVMNASAASRDLAARVGFGFGLEPSDPVTDWSAVGGTLTGGTTTFTVVDQAVASSLPAYDGTLWRMAHNAVELTFDRDIAAPTAADLEIRELLDDGAFGTNLSDRFTYEVTNDGSGNPRVLTLIEDFADLTGGVVLTDGTWYAVRNTGAWSSVAPFRVHELLRRGDANGDTLVQFADLAFVNASINAGSGKWTDRADVNGDTLVQFADLAAVNAFIGASWVEKPTGHD